MSKFAGQITNICLILILGCCFTLPPLQAETKTQEATTDPLLLPVWQSLEEELKALELLNDEGQNDEGQGDDVVADESSPDDSRLQADNADEAEPGVMASPDQNLNDNPAKTAGTGTDTSKKLAVVNKQILMVVPPRLSAVQGQEIVFRNRHQAKLKQARYYWQVGGQVGTSSQFKPDTHQLKAGTHKVYVTANINGSLVQDTALLTLTVRRNKRVPNLVGLPVSQAMKILLEDGLKVGTIQQRKANVKRESVIHQSLKPGTMVKSGRVINLVEGLPNDPNANKVSIKASRKTVSKGGVVNFKALITPKPNNTKGMNYLFNINGKQHKSLQPDFNWRFDTMGIFPVSVIIRNSQGALGKSSTLRIKVDNVWQKPEAKIIPEVLVIRKGDRAEFTSTSLYDLQSTLNYQWKSQTGHEGNEKRFLFETKDLEPGRYDIELEVVDRKKLKSSAIATLVLQAATPEILSSGKALGNKGIADSTNTSSRARNKDNDKADGAPGLQLEVSDHYARVGDVLNFVLRTDIAPENAEYQFELGDQSTGQWQLMNAIEHRYDTFGSYSVRAAIKIDDEVYYSKPKTIWVWSPFLFVSVGGIGSALLALMWWWTGRVPGGKIEDGWRLSERLENDKNRVSLRQIFFYFIQFMIVMLISAIGIYWLLNH